MRSLVGQLSFQRTSRSSPEALESLEREGAGRRLGLPELYCCLRDYLTRDMRRLNLGETQIISSGLRCEGTNRSRPPMSQNRTRLGQLQFCHGSQ